ncbi:MAG: TetR/AcrR family transcriptional regulator [Clostridia bacterium]|nr:TetR/AcrR family transcriptional regulator [Clostridia bacterium]
MAQCKKENIREAILAEALDSFAENGYESTTIKDIAQKCKISTGNVYKYFKSKAEIYETLITDDFLEQLHDLIATRSYHHAEALKNELSNDVMRWFDKEYYPFFIKNAKQCIILKNHYLGKEYDERVSLIVKNVLMHKKRAMFQTNQPLPPHFLNISAMLIASNVQMYVQVLEMNKSDEEKTELLKMIDKYHVGGTATIFKEN